jgi:uncharacterized membrane protein YkvA (DUF1232 family)
MQDFNNRFKTEKEEEQYVRKNIWKKIKATASKVPFVPDIVSIYFCAIDSNTPLKARLTAWSALAYFILPIDVIPDAIPLAGYGDDAGVIFAAFKTIKPYITEEHKAKARNWLNENTSSEIKADYEIVAD